jgi:type II restriction enzyme
LKNYDFSKSISPEDGVFFMKESGFLNLLSNRNIKSIPDYFLGVEVGLDSNGRKNRGGTAMETITELFVKDICDRKGFEYIAQATAAKIKSKWNKDITVKNSSKTVDFAINTPQKLYLIETNFYGGGGSKLKSTAGEYSDIYNQWTSDGHQFIWVTDGIGWKTTQRPLRDTFNSTDYIINLDMIQKGILEGIIG